MTPEQQIQINELLLHREEAFARIYDIEQEINALLGAAYPFTVPQLPSHTKPKKKRAKKKTSKLIKLRTLEANESAYKIVYEQDGQTMTETHTQLAAVEQLLQLQATTLIVSEIFAIDSTGDVVSVLYQKKKTELKIS